MENNLIPTWYKIDHSKKIIDFQSSANGKLSPLDSAEVAINYILETYPKPYYLMVSGGVDSQAVLYSWKLFGKDYIPTYVTYNKTLNSHDLETLFIFSKKYKIDLLSYDFDVLDFYNTQHEEYVYKYNCPSPHLTVHLSMIKNLPGTAIMSGNFLYDPCFIPLNQIGLHNSSSDRFIPFFFWSQPDLAYSLILHRKKNNYIETPTTLMYDYKVKEYIDMGYPVISQGKIKYSGFEQIKEIYREKYKPDALTRLKCYAERHNYDPYDQILRYPYEKKIGLYNYKGILNSTI